MAGPGGNKPPSTGGQKRPATNDSRHTTPAQSSGIKKARFDAAASSSPAASAAATSPLAARVVALAKASNPGVKIGSTGSSGLARSAGLARGAQGGGGHAADDDGALTSRLSCKSSKVLTSVQIPQTGRRPSVMLRTSRRCGTTSRSRASS